MNHSPAAAGEEVLWSGSISHWHYAGRWLFFWLALGALVATFIWPIQDAWLPNGDLHAYGMTLTGVLILRVALGVFALAILLWIWVARSRRKYLVTDKRVSVELGIVSKKSNEIRIDHIRSINFTSSGISGLFGIGKVEFSSAATDEAEVIFWYVPRAEKIRDMVRSLQTIKETAV